MKNFSLILILIFSYFVCIVNVYAVVPTSCRSIDNSDPSQVVQAGCVYSDVVRSSEVYHGYGPDGNSEFVEAYYWNYSDGSYVNNYNLFGYYQDGNLIGYTRPPHADDWSYRMPLHFYHKKEVYTDSNGNVSYYTFFNYTQYVDIVFGNYFSSGHLNRLDFNVHINLTSIPDLVRNNILGNLSVDVTMPTIAGSYCTAKYDYDVIKISCSFDYNGEEPYVRISNLVGQDYVYNSSVNSYDYWGYFDVSELTTVWSTNGDPYELGTTESPGGAYFDSYYDYIKTNSSWFSEFNYSSLNDISQIVTSPLRLINNLNSESYNTLDFNIFGKSFSLKNGYYYFWGRCPISLLCQNPFSTSVINGNTVTAQQKFTILNTFKTFWNGLFGGVIIYFLAKMIVRVSMKCFNSDDSSLVVF